MDTSAQTITTMGIVSNEVYNNNKTIVDYFKDEYDTNGNKIVKFIRGTTYKVIDHTPASNQGFNALLLQDTTTGKYVIAFRGTQEKFDIVDDAIIGLQNHSYEFEAAKAWVDKVLHTQYDGKYIPKENLTFTGHSLGAILTQAVGAVYQVPGYAFNPYGVDRLLLMPSTPIIPNLLLDVLAGAVSAAVYKALSAFGLESSYADWAKNNILNISYVDDGMLKGDPLSNMATDLTSKQLGDVLQIWGVDRGGDAHKMPNLNEAIQHYNDVLSRFNNTTYKTLTDVYSLTGYDHAEQVFNDLDIYSYNNNNLSFDFLINKPPYQLNDKSLPNLYALLHSNPFAIEGNLPAYNDINPDDYSPAFMTDRANYLYYILDKENRYGDGSGKDSYKAFDSYGVDLEGKTGNQVIFGTDYVNNSFQLKGGDGNDRIYGLGGDDELIGGTGNDYLEGGKGSDTLEGGAGEDTLIGSYNTKDDDNTTDTLKGGSGKDTYIAGDGDIIEDEEGNGIIKGEGRVLFDNSLLKGGNWDKDKGAWIGEDGTRYILSGDTLSVIKDFGKTTQKSLTINKFDNYINGTADMQEIGIKLTGKDFDDGSGHACPQPIQPITSFNLNVPTAPVVGTLSGGSTSVSRTYSGGGSSYTPRTYLGGGSYTPPPHSPPPVYECVYTPELSSMMTGSKLPKLPLTSAPVVLDLNGNGITSISLAASQALFDYQGDSLKEHTAWIESGDALLGVDVNGDGVINDGSELFGDYTKLPDGSNAADGYEALAQYDSNNDGVINADDEKFNDLKLFKDANQNGVTDAGELVSLSDEGITEISLNTSNGVTYQTQDENSNTITNETTYSTASTTGTVRDLWFAYENREQDLPDVYFDMDGDGFAENMQKWSKTDEWILVKDTNGDGVINNGKEIVGTQMLLGNGKYANDSYSAMSTFDINNDGVLDSNDNSGLGFWMDKNHNAKTDAGELETLGDVGAVQRIKLNPYQTMLSGYDANHDGKIASSDAVYNYMYRKVNDDGSITLYLPDNAVAKEMIKNYIGNEEIQTNLGNLTISNIIFYQGELALNNEVTGTDSNDKIKGNRRANIISGAKGDDELIGGAGDDTYTFNLGDGKDLIVDSAGNDTLEFGVGITRDDLTIRSNGSDIAIYINDTADKVVVKDWHQTSNRIEAIKFADGSFMNTADIVETLGTDEDDTIFGTQSGDALDGGKGDDRLIGGDGSDTYLFERGDGIDTIEDSGGYDSLKFGDGITADDLIFKAFGSNMVVALKEDGVALEDLSQAIMLKDWYSPENRIESISFSDGTTLGINDMLMGLGTDGDDTIVGTELNDVFVFNLGDGNDTIIDNLGENKILFGEGISTDNLTLMLNGNDLVIDVNGTNDSITFKSWYDQLKNISFADDSVLDRDAILQLASSDGDDVISTGDGDDTLYGGKGDDTLSGGRGNDTYIYNLGDGKDTISDISGNDTIQFGDGINSENITFQLDGNDLLIEVNGTENSIKFSSWYDQLENISFADGTTLNRNDILSFVSSDEDDIISTGNGNDVVFGAKGNDTINTFGGDDTIYGGEGNDTLQGGYGNDTYVFSRGDGQDTILDASGNDTLKFGTAITQDDLIIKQDGNNLIVALQENGVEFDNLTDKITISNWLNGNNTIESFSFADASTMNVNDMMNAMTSEGDDTLVSPNNQTVNVDLQSGNDSITTGYGNDTIAGGTGNDTLQGGYGNDTYVFSRGDGQDTILDASGNDTLKFGTAITQDDLIIKQDGNNLIVALQENGVEFDNLTDKITISNWLNGNNTIESFSFADASTMNVNDMMNAMTSEGDDTLVSPNNQTVNVDLQSGNDSITTGYGNDTITGGTGDDSINASSGDDILTGGTGDDTLQGGNGNDTYIFNSGDGKDTVLDISGNDTIKFGAGIDVNDLVFETDGNDVRIGLRENGKLFSELSDVITVQNMLNTTNTIDNFSFTDDKTYTLQEMTKYGILGSDDTITGTTSSDVLIGGQGNDLLEGSSGNDIYMFGRGDGHDTINDYYHSNYQILPAGYDILQFGSDITSNNIIARADGYNLVVGIKEANIPFSDLKDKVTIVDFFGRHSWNGYSVEEFRFENGETFDYKQIIDLQATEGDDNIRAYTNLADTINAGGGDDVITGSDRNDIIYGGKGNDTINVSAGNNTVYGNEGADTLQGGYGNDTYVFNRGDGQDTITDASGNDTLKFGTNITQADLIIKTEGNNLVVALKEDGVAYENLTDKITIKDWYNSINRVENIAFLDDASATMDVFAIVSAIGEDADDTIDGTELNDTLNGEVGDNIMNAKGGNDTVYGNNGNDIIDAGAGDDIVYGNAGNDTIYGNDGNDTLDGGLGADVLQGGVGEDTIYGNVGDDTISGGAGNDTLYGNEGSDILQGEAGDDTYIFHRGDGQDTITDASGNDTLKFGTNITQADLIIKTEGNNLVVALKEDGVAYENLTDKITIKDWYNSINRVENIAFLDDASATMDVFAIVSAIGEDADDTIDGTELNDTLNGEVGDNIMNAKGGNDTVYGNNGNDIIDAGAGDDIVYGNAGNDTIYGNDGDDILYGNSGDDRLEGGQGNDIYVFNRGDGKDNIYDYRSGNYLSSSEVDSLKFGPDITADDLLVHADGDNLIIALKENSVAFQDLSDKVTILNFFNKSYYSDSTIEEFRFDHRVVLSYQDILNLQATPGDDSIGTFGDVALNVDSGDGNDIINGSYYVDTLHGGSGDDIIRGNGGDDTFYGDAGDDRLEGGYDNDTYIFNRGDGHDTIFDQGSYGDYYRRAGAQPVVALAAVSVGNGSGPQDIIKFTDVTSIDDLAVELNGNNLIIGIKEGNTEISQLSDTITIESWQSDYNRNTVETIQLADGTTYNISEYFNIPLQSTSRSDMEGPIVLDLNQNGITSISIDTSTAYFDYDSNGQREHTAWSDKGDAILAIDLNEDGKINDGGELFGDHTLLPDGTVALDGYEALSQYDSNGDNVINAQDEKFSDLLLWKDNNQDGKSSFLELTSLSQSAITTINLSREDGTTFKQITENGNLITNETNYTGANTDGLVRDVWFNIENDNTISNGAENSTNSGTFSEEFDNVIVENEMLVDATQTLSDTGIDELVLQSRYTGYGTNGVTAQTVFEGDGFEGVLSNKWYARNTLDTKYEFTDTISDDIESLPGVKGQGTVRDLQHVMSDDEILAQEVSDYQEKSSTQSFTEIEADIDAILDNWALSDTFGNLNTNEFTPPLVLDLNNNGITSISLENSNAYFDFNGDDRREHTAWAEEGDAILAVDLNSNGTIDNGSELFGKQTKLADGSFATDGYEALVQYDTNNDNIINASDDKFSDLLLWKDSNGDGKSSISELSSLESNGVTSINLSRTDGSTFDQVSENGNIITNETNYDSLEGEGTVRDVWFKYNSSDTIAVSNLSDADERKISIVEAFLGMTLTEQARANPYVMAKVFNQYDALKYDTMAKFISNKLYGEDFPSCQFLYDGLNNTLARVASGNSTATETVLAVNLLASMLKRDQKETLSEINRSYLANDLISGILEKSGIVIDYEKGEIVGQIGSYYYGRSSDEVYDFSNLNNAHLYAAEGNDEILGSQGRDNLKGGAGNDTINGNGGVDIIAGGEGDDILIGGSEQNVYEYYFADGDDVIIDSGSTEGAPDILRLSHILIDDIKLERVNDDMIIKIKGFDQTFDNSFGSITIKDGYTTGAIELFQFDTQEYTLEDLLRDSVTDTNYAFDKGDSLVTIYDKGGDDKVYFGDSITADNLLVKKVGDNLVIGIKFENRLFENLPDQLTIKDYFKSSNTIESFIFSDGTTLNSEEILNISASSEIIVAQEEDATIYGSSGDDVFDGGSGDDTIFGEGGDDKYYFGLGDGHDTIVDTKGVDTVVLKPGIDLNDMLIKLDGDDLILSLNDGSSVLIKSWNLEEYTVENLVDSNGNKYVLADMLQDDLIVNTAPTVLESETNIILQDVRVQTGIIEASDVDGDTLSYSVTAQAEHGTVSVDETGIWTYDVDALYLGEDSAVVTIDDGKGGSVTKTLNFNTQVSKPTIDTLSLNLLEDSIFADTLNVSNPVGGELTYKIITPSTSGDFAVDENGLYSYNPNQDYNGTDSVTIEVTNEYGLSTVSTLTFDIEAVNDAPIANTDTATTDENSSLVLNIEELLANDTDVDLDDTMTITNVTAPLGKGVASLDNTSGNFIFEVGSDFDHLAQGVSEDVSVVYTIEDSQGASSSSEVIITITGTNDSPIIKDIASATTNEDDLVVTGHITSTDIDDNATVSYSTTTVVAGFILNSDGSYSFNPADDAYQSLAKDEVQEITIPVTATDEYNATDTKNLLITVIGTNDIPTVDDIQEVNIFEDDAIVTGQISANDVDDAAVLSYTTVSTVAGFTLNDNGSYAFDASNQAYQHLENGAVEKVTISVKVADEYNASVTTDIVFMVTGTNDRPIIEDITPVNITEDATIVTGNIIATDVDDNATALFSTTAAVSGFTLNTDGSYSFNPIDKTYQSLAKDEIKEIVIPIIVTDDQGATNSKELIITVVGTNDIPTVETIETKNILEDSTVVTGRINAQDIDDGAILHYSSSSAAAGFTLNNDGSYSFNPADDAYQHLAEGEVETVIIPVTIKDEYNASVTTDIIFKVTGTNDAPVIESIAPITVHEDDALVTGKINATDVDDNATALFTTTATVAGFTLNADGSYSFNPADDAYQFLAKDEVQTITIPVTVTDDQGAQDTKELTLSVVGTNDIPTVTVDTQALSLQNIRNIDGTTIANDIDATDTLSYSVATQAQHGEVTIDANGKWHYKAEGSFNGEDSATVLVDDGNGGTVTQTLNFTVDGYIYEGEDLIIDEASGNDTLSMTNINKEQLSFSRADGNLLIAVDDGGVITLKNYFTNTQAGVETLHTAQGDINLSRDVINDVESHWWHGSFRAKDDQDHLISGTNNNDWLEGNTGNDIILGNNKYDWLQGNAGDDLLVGGDANDRLYGNEGSDNLYGDAGNDWLDGGEGNDALIGGAGRDRLYGDVGNDYLAGGSGNDRLDGDKGDDTLIGGAGDDYLEGYYGSDTYIFNQGDGHDTIDEWSKKGSSDTDTLRFGEGITQDDLTIKRERYDAIFELDAENSVRVKDWFDDDNRSVIEQIQFTDGTQLLASEVNDLAIVEGNNHNNRLYGMDKLNDNLFGLGGNDRLYGYEGDDFLSGGSGKDRLYGDQGADTLIGGAENDYLEGYYGSDTYEFAKGDGHDTIDEWSKKGSSDIDTIKFAEGITQSDVSFTMQHGDMFIQYATDDLIKVKDADDTRGQIEKVELSNGLYVTNDDINLIIQQINAYGVEKGMDHISNNDIQNNSDLMNIVSSAWHE